MRLLSLGSGSRGNGLVLESGGRALLVDCGFGPRALVTRLRAVGLVPEQIEGLVLTHEHTDHASGAERAQHKWRWPVYASAGTLAALPEIAARWRRPIAPGTALATDGFALEAVAVPHDAAAPLAFAITHTASGARVGIAHDLGAVPDGLRQVFARCDAILLEANHDAEMLRTGPYAASLKARIRGGRGHIDNAQAGALLGELMHPGLRAAGLLHLSETNNTPEVAARGVRAAMGRAAAGLTLTVAAGRAPSVLAVLGVPQPASTQLSFAL